MAPRKKLQPDGSRLIMGTAISIDMEMAGNIADNR
jgi:hypothetical protein